MILCFPDFSWTSEDRKARSGWKQGMFTLPEGSTRALPRTPTDTTLWCQSPVDNKRRQLWDPAASLTGCQPTRNNLAQNHKPPGLCESFLQTRQLGHVMPCRASTWRSQVTARQRRGARRANPASASQDEAQAEGRPRQRDRSPPPPRKAEKLTSHGAAHGGRRKKLGMAGKGMPRSAPRRSAIRRRAQSRHRVGTRSLTVARHERQQHGAKPPASRRKATTSRKRASSRSASSRVDHKRRERRTTTAPV